MKLIMISWFWNFFILGINSFSRFVDSVPLTNFIDTNKCVCGRTFSPKIVGGQGSEPGEFPWQVGIELINDGPFCGGTLISDRHVVSAAHCFIRTRKSLKEMQLLLGASDYDNLQMGFESRNIANITIHPKFHLKLGFNDIALLTMDKPVKFSMLINPICFPRPGIPYNGTKMTVTGWGRTSEGGPVSTKLLQVEVPVRERPICLYKLGRHAMLKSQICAFWDEGEKDACQGDSGSGMVFKDGNHWYFAGVVSYGWGCAQSGMPALYTRLDYYYSWLNMKTKNGIFCTT